MTPQRYLLAKYVADVRRMEPFNIGVILWAGGRVGAKFLEPSEAYFVNDKQTYERWTRFWDDMVYGSEPARIQGREVPRDRPEFLDELRKTQKGNYLLLEGGQLTDKIRPNELAAATAFLFQELVARRSQHIVDPYERALRLRATADKLFHDAGLKGREDFHTNYRVACKVRDAEKEFRFSYALGNGLPDSVYQRVRVGAPQSVHSAAFMFEWLLNSQEQLARQNCAAIVQTSPNEEGASETQASLELLGQFSTVINLEDYQRAIDQLRLVAERRPA